MDTGAVFRQKPAQVGVIPVVGVGLYQFQLGPVAVTPLAGDKTISPGAAGKTRAQQVSCQRAWAAREDWTAAATGSNRALIFGTVTTFVPSGTHFQVSKTRFVFAFAHA